MHDGVICVTGKDVDTALLVLGLVVVQHIRDGLGVGRNWEVTNEDLGVLVLVLLEVALNCVESSLALSLLALLLLIDDLLLHLGKLGAEFLVHSLASLPS